MDVTRKEDIKRAFSRVLDNNKGLYGLINGAGVIRLGPGIEAPEEELLLQFNINTFGMYNVTTEFYPLIKESRGTIVNISSAAGIQCIKQYHRRKLPKAYTMSLQVLDQKAGILYLIGKQVRLYFITNKMK